MDNPEGQVTYPIRNRTAGLPTSSSTFLGVHCVFIFVFIIKPYGTINLIRQIQIRAYFQTQQKPEIFARTQSPVCLGIHAFIKCTWSWFSNEICL